MRATLATSLIACVVLGDLGTAALAQETLYGVTDTHLLRISTSIPAVVNVVGAHGLEPADLGNGRTLGAFSMTYDRTADRLLGLYYDRDAITGAFDQYLVEYDRITGAATILNLLASSNLDGFVEAIEYVDGSDAVVVSRDLQGSVTTSLEAVNLDGTTTPIVDNGRDNDYAVYDQTRARMYVIDPNGIGALSHLDLGTGVTTNLGPIKSSTGDMAYSAEDDRILAYVVGSNELVSLGDGFVIQLPELLGYVGTPGVIQGLAIVNGDVQVCEGDTNNDGYLDNGDIYTFIQLFLNVDPRSDYTNDGVIDNSDVSGFLVSYFAGCPG